MREGRHHIITQKKKKRKKGRKQKPKKFALGHNDNYQPKLIQSSKQAKKESGELQLVFPREHAN